MHLGNFHGSCSADRVALSASRGETALRGRGRPRPGWGPWGEWRRGVAPGDPGQERVWWLVVQWGHKADLARGGERPTQEDALSFLGPPV